MKNLSRLSWTSIAVMVGLPVLLGFIAWLIYILSHPSQWCGTPVGAAKTTGQRLPIADCTNIVLQLIHWLGWWGLGLIACVCVAFLTIVTRDLKAGLDATGPGGTSLHLGGDAAQAADTVAGAAVDAAAQVKGEAQ
jgi:hypothetical protein